MCEGVWCCVAENGCGFQCDAWEWCGSVDGAVRGFIYGESDEMAVEFWGRECEFDGKESGSYVCECWNLHSDVDGDECVWVEHSYRK